VPVELSPSPTVHDVPVEPLSMPIARPADPAFEERWAAWRARRLRHERAVQRRLRVVGLVIAVVVGLVTLGLRLLRDSS
jgi:type VI protein secretion system component VasF